MSFSASETGRVLPADVKEFIIILSVVSDAPLPIEAVDICVNKGVCETEEVLLIDRAVLSAAWIPKTPSSDKFAGLFKTVLTAFCSCQICTISLCWFISFET
ncbi:hypothetical protein [Flavobacterium ginsengiterrae]|uniref:hypothetical protein n=1 Tax=Flavobacterium ginsengiterrae TaxID=871695 RepID=UPI0031E9E377